MTIDIMFFVKPWHYNKFINRYGMPIPKNLLKYFTKYLPSTHISLNVFYWQARKSIQTKSSIMVYTTHLNTMKAFPEFFVSSHETLSMVIHRYYICHNVLNKRLCECTKPIIHTFFHLFFEGLSTCNVGFIIYKIAN